MNSSKTIVDYLDKNEELDLDKIIVLDSYIAGITQNLVKEKLKKRKMLAKNFI